MTMGHSLNYKKDDKCPICGKNRNSNGPYSCQCEKEEHKEEKQFDQYHGAKTDFSYWNKSNFFRYPPTHINTPNT